MLVSCKQWFLGCCYQAVEERYLTVLLDLLSKLDVSILFVQVFVEFVDFVFVYSSAIKKDFEID